MKILEQGMNFCSVTLAEREVNVRTIKISGIEEAVAEFSVTPDTFRFVKGGWEVARSENSADYGRGGLEGLDGMEADFSAASSINELGGVPAVIKELLRDCVKGVIQAESYLIAERGFKTRSDYDTHWDVIWENSCRYYTYLEKEIMRWTDYVDQYPRKNLLFTRYKSYNVSASDGGDMELTGAFHDSFHEMNVKLLCGADGVVKSLEALFSRAPGPACFECTSLFSNMEGFQVTAAKRDVGKAIGGAEGCFHMVDLVYDLLEAGRRQLK